jgi:hypothetical protein
MEDIMLEFENGSIPTGEFLEVINELGSDLQYGNYSDPGYELKEGKMKTVYKLYEARYPMDKNDAEIIIALPSFPANTGRYNCIIMECSENGYVGRYTEEISLDYLRIDCRAILDCHRRKYEGYIMAVLNELDAANDNQLGLTERKRISAQRVIS